MIIKVQVTGPGMTLWGVSRIIKDALEKSHIKVNIDGVDTLGGNSAHNFKRYCGNVEVELVEEHLPWSG